jgi:Na+-transporting methylmalonyl-CoA/oxaloacetate decarboxylase gamma subunit
MMMGFLKFILILLVVVWFVGLVIRATFSRFLRKRTEEFNRAARQAQRQAQSRGRREGEVRVEATGPAVEKKVSRGVGEYVEFEEIDVIQSETKTAK